MYQVVQLNLLWLRGLRFMNESKKCTICKHLGLETPNLLDVERSYLYENNGDAVAVFLCRTHAVQLFKLGQKSFLLSHYQILNDCVDTDEKKFINILEQTVRKFPDYIV